MDRMRPMIARALREMDERLKAEKIIPAVERIKPKAREKRISGVTLEKTTIHEEIRLWICDALPIQWC